VECICVYQDKHHWRALANTVMNFLLP
jgi:hypothetical protein